MLVDQDAELVSEVDRVVAMEGAAAIEWMFDEVVLVFATNEVVR